jgi:hypothetical protein
MNKPTKLKKIIESFVEQRLNELDQYDSMAYENALKVSMVIMSHLSDIQAENPKLNGKLNFIKHLVMELEKNPKIKMNQDELDQLYFKYVK